MHNTFSLTCLDIFLRLDQDQRQPDDPAVDGRMRGLEWLYPESMARALTGGLNQHGLEPSLRLELESIAARDHDWLIGLRPEPPIRLWHRHPYFSRLTAFDLLTPDDDPVRWIQSHHDPQRLIVAINPRVPQDSWLPRLKAAVESHKAKLGHQHGQGNRVSLSRLWEGLLAHDWKRLGASNRDIGEWSRTFEPLAEDKRENVAGHDTLEKHGEKLVELAKRMITAARAGESAWFHDFRY